MRIIEGQIMASTSVDRHGEQLTEEQLTKLYEQQPIPWILYAEHSFAKKPVARAIKKDLVRLPDGILAIACDLEVWDENEFGRFGGMSISFTTTRFSAVANDDTPDVMLLFNPRIIDHDDAVSLIHLTDDEVRIDVKILVQKNFDVPIQAILLFGTAAAFGGFFSEMGKDAYRALRDKLVAWGKQTTETHEEDLTCQFIFEYGTDDANPTVVVTVSSACLDELAKLGISEDSIISEVKRVFELRRVRKVSLTLADMKPTWAVEYIIDVDGNVTVPTAPGAD